MNYESIPKDIRVLIDQGHVNTTAFREKCYAYFKKIPNAMVTTKEEFEAWHDANLKPTPMPASTPPANHWDLLRQKKENIWDNGYYIIGEKVYDIPEDTTVEVDFTLDRSQTYRTTRIDTESASGQVEVNVSYLFESGEIDRDYVLNNIETDDLDFESCDSEYGDNDEWLDTSYETPDVNLLHLQDSLHAYYIGDFSQFSQEGRLVQ